MNDRNHKPIPLSPSGNHLTERLWVYDDYADIEKQSADSVAGLASLGFIRAALRRSAWLWRIAAATGLVIGLAFALLLHPVYQASTSVILNPMSTGGEDAGAPIANEQALAQSRTVAQLAMNKLGIQESVSSFLGSYTVTSVTDRVLSMTVSAPSSSAAVTRANVIAKEYLNFRAQLVEQQQDLLFATLDQQVSQARQRVNSIDAKISELQSSSGAQQSTLSKLQAEKTQATSNLNTLEENVDGAKASAQITTDTIVQDSRVLDSATALSPPSRLKHALEYTVLGLIAGLVVGLGIVIVRALISDRLLRRDDVAYAMDAPVKLSVGRVRLRRRGLAAAEDASVRRIVSYLDSMMPPARAGLASLAVVAVDDVKVPAVCLVSLAISLTKRGNRVVVADLCDGAPAARLLDSPAAGVRSVSVDGTRLMVAVPANGDIAPAGPLRRGPDGTRVDESVASACESADVLLTLVTLDPSLGGGHLAGWAGRAVVTVTAGRSSAARIRSVAEMIRLAGTQLISGVLIGADKTDESLGLPDAPASEGHPMTDEVGRRSAMQSTEAR
jgi:capsular polysaccharide biosynthesis protein